MGDAGRVLIIPKGDYDPNAQYEMLDLVFENGSSYLCKKPTTGHAPSDTEYWQIFATGSVIKLVVPLLAGETEVRFSNQNLSATSTVMVNTEVDGLEYTSIAYDDEEDEVVVTFPEQSEDVNVQLVVIN